MIVISYLDTNPTGKKNSASQITSEL